MTPNPTSSCSSSSSPFAAPLDSAIYAWSYSTGFIRNKFWDSWDWKDNIQQAKATPPTSSSCPVSFPMSSSRHLLTVMKGSNLTRLAGLSGAAAVALGAYGAHNFSADKADFKKIYETANFYHFVHTLALLGAPLSRRPLLTGSLFLAGMTIFCGTTYYHALTEEKSLRKFTPYGGILLIVAWLSLVF